MLVSKPLFPPAADCKLTLKQDTEQDFVNASKNCLEEH